MWISQTSCLSATSASVLVVKAASICVLQLAAMLATGNFDMDSLLNAGALGAVGSSSNMQVRISTTICAATPLICSRELSAPQMHGVHMLVRSTHLAG